MGAGRDILVKDGLRWGGVVTSDWQSQNCLLVDQSVTYRWKDRETLVESRERASKMIRRLRDLCARE